MWEDSIFVWLIIILLGAVGINLFGLGIYDTYRDWTLRRQKGISDGEIVGLVKSHLFRNDIFGEVSGDTMVEWESAQGKQFWGGVLIKRIPAWFPCVRYQTPKKEICVIMTEGAQQEKWKIGQRVTVIYDPEKIRTGMIKGDNSMRKRANSLTISGGIILLFCALIMGIFL